MRSGSSWPITRSALTADTPKLDSRVRTVLRTSWAVLPYFLRATARVKARSSIGFSESAGEGSSQADEPHSANISFSTESAKVLNGTRCGTRLSAVFIFAATSCGNEPSLFVDIKFLALRARHFSAPLPRDQEQLQAQPYSTRYIAIAEIKPKRLDFVITQYALSRRRLGGNGPALDAAAGSRSR